MQFAGLRAVFVARRTVEREPLRMPFSHNPSRAAGIVFKRLLAIKSVTRFLRADYNFLTAFLTSVMLIFWASDQNVYSSLL